MKDYRSLPERHLWTLTQASGKGEDGMTIRDGNTSFHLTVMPYPEDVYNDILAQAAQYQIVEDSCTGAADRPQDIRHHASAVTPHSIVVKENRFAGVFTLCTYGADSFMQTVRRDSYQGLLFADGTTAGINRDEFEGSPGGFRHICDYSLEKR